MQIAQSSKIKQTIAAAILAVSLAPLAQAQDFVKLQFSDGRANVAGVENVSMRPANPTLSGAL